MPLLLFSSVYNFPLETYDTILLFVWENTEKGNYYNPIYKKSRALFLLTSRYVDVVKLSQFSVFIYDLTIAHCCAVLSLKTEIICT